ncbi:MAG: glycosyltransferase [Acidobacteriia bacterium]|nr:glycosyltransferase [Terriglobia bacterium]
MRILILVDCYVPSVKSGARQIRDLAAEFHRQGHEVTVITPSHEIVDEAQVTWDEGTRIVRVRTGKIKGVGRIWRALEEIRLSGVVWRRVGRFLLENPADFIVFYSPTIFWSALVRRLKALWGCPAYLILRAIRSCGQDRNPVSGKRRIFHERISPAGISIGGALQLDGSGG